MTRGPGRGELGAEEHDQGRARPTPGVPSSIRRTVGRAQLACRGKPMVVWPREERRRDELPGHTSRQPILASGTDR